MPFVGKRIHNREQQRNPKPMPAKQVVRRSAKRARGEGGEDGILSEMAGLAHQQMKDCQGFIPNIWIQPLHGAQKKRRMRRREDVARIHKD